MFLLCIMYYIESESNWATSRENLFMPYVNNKGADQPAHPCSLISAFIVRCLGSITPNCYIRNFKTLASLCLSEQAGLSHIWLQTLKTAFLVTWLNCIWYAWYAFKEPDQWMNYKTAWFETDLQLVERNMHLSKMFKSTFVWVIFMKKKPQTIQNCWSIWINSLSKCNSWHDFSQAYSSEKTPV